MSEVVSINQTKSFTRKEANEFIPIIYRITEVASANVKSLLNRMDAVKLHNAETAAEFEKQIEIEVQRWESKLEKLGAIPKGLWIADFDFGEGYYCWKFPETKIQYFHGYSEGFTGRKEIHIHEEYSVET